MRKHGKKYLAASAQIDNTKAYAPQEAISLLKQVAFAKFDQTVDLHMRLGVDPRHADQQVRGVISLPSGTGKVVRIMVFAEGEAARIAQEAGADYVGTDEYAQKIQEGWMDFDVALAIPQVMGKIGRLGRFLGRRGLMPNPKAGTIVQPDDMARAIREARQGRVEFRLDRTSNLHVPIGKTSFTIEQLVANFDAAMDAVQRAKPSGAKGQYIKKIAIAPTMGPGIKLDVTAATASKAA
jgi:large subunit ribosomal protein L1